jgi:hypothetical protein
MPSYNNDIFNAQILSIKKTRLINTFQEHFKTYCKDDVWWKSSGLLVSQVRHHPFLSKVTNLNLIYPPLYLSPATRLGDITGLSELIATKIIADQSYYCDNCNMILATNSPIKILDTLTCPAIAITARANPAQIKDLQFSRAIINSQMIELDSLNEITSDLEIIIDRVKLNNPEIINRISHAINYTETHSLKSTCLRPWPLDNTTYPLGSDTTCASCRTHFLPPDTMRNQLLKNIWKIPHKDHLLLNNLYISFDKISNFDFDLILELELGYYTPTQTIKEVDPGHLQIFLIQKHFNTINFKPTAILPLNYFLSSKATNRLSDAINNFTQKYNRSIITQLTECADEKNDSFDYTNLCIKSINRLEAGKIYVLPLNRATLYPKLQTTLEALLPNSYNIYTLSYLPSTNTDNTSIAQYLGIIPALSKTYALHPIARIHGLKETFFSKNVMKFKCTFCHGKNAQCTVCNGMSIPLEADRVRYKGKTFIETLNSNFSQLKNIIGHIPKALTLIEGALVFGFSDTRLSQPLKELNIVDQWRLKVLKLILHTPSRSCLIIPDLRWCLTHQQLAYIQENTDQRLTKKAIIIQIANNLCK